MRILVTGAGGFAGQHLVRYLSRIYPAADIYGTLFRAEIASPVSGVNYTRIDLCQPEAVNRLVEQIQPEVIYHLAGQSSPARSFKSPWDTLETNLRAQLNVLQACVDISLFPRILVISSAEVYGAVKPDELPLRETSPLRPHSPYSLSKITQDMMGWQYFLSYQLPVIRVRAFNHTGPGQQEHFVVATFAMQIARIEAGLQPPVIRVGNLSARRDFTDVRDTVRAYHWLIEKGISGEVYNVASGRTYAIQWILNMLVSFSAAPVSIQMDTDRLRPSDIPIIQGDFSRLHEATGWHPEIPFEQTLRDILDDCRQRIKSPIRS